MVGALLAVSCAQTTTINIAFIESNFLAKSDLKALRSFQTPLSSLPSGIIPRRLSCFVYIRDAFAHDPSGVLLSQGANTVHFTTAIADGSFPWATISGQEIFISPQAAHELHLDILRFFGAP